MSLPGDPNGPTRVNAEVLLWQGRVRIALALVVGGIAFVLQQSGMLPDIGMWLFAIIAGYMVLIASMAWWVRRAGSAGNYAVAATIAADLVFIFASTIASSTPAYYERILILSFFILHLTESYFGGGHASFALSAVVAGYLGLIWFAIDGGASLSWPDQIWSVGLFAVGGIVFILHYGKFRRRLERIVELFESAEHGDFTKAYNEAADRTPDSITAVGRAYNRVRVRLASLVLTDPLTGCLNRRGLNQAIAREIARAGRAGSDLSLLAIDLDHFKRINDNYGHVAGDIVLRELGALLVHTARAGDMVARVGGEEFSVLLPDTDPSGAYRAAVRVCDAVRTHIFLIGGKRVVCTISVGVVSSSAIGNDSSGGMMMERADEALYAAKDAGRDRVNIWSGELVVV